MSLQSWGCLRKLSNSVFAVHLKSRHFHSASSLFSDANIKNIKKTVVSEDDRRNQGLTKDNPVLVASHTDKIIVGCNCNSKTATLKWFFLEEGNAQVCDCGYYFKLDPVEKKSWIPKYSQVMQVDKEIEDPRRGREGLPFMRPKIVSKEKSGK